MSTNTTIKELVTLMRKQYTPCYLQESTERLSTIEVQRKIEEHAGNAKAEDIRTAMLEAGFMEEYLTEEGFVYPVRKA